jgi:hypothetical protein
VLLEPPVHLEGVGDVRAIELAEGRAGECPAAEAAYLGGDFEVLARPRVLFYSKSPADEDTPGSFRRGDADGSGKAELADAVALLSALYLGGPEPACPDAADYNDDGFLEVADAILLLSYLFRGFQGAFPPGPEECGLDPTCDALPPCRSGCRF